MLNNIGYSFLLRGDLRRARAKFAEAQRKDPENPTIANNIALVDRGRAAQEGAELSATFCQIASVTPG